MVPPEIRESCKRCPPTIDEGTAEKKVGYRDEKKDTQGKWGCEGSNDIVRQFCVLLKGENLQGDVAWKRRIEKGAKETTTLSAREAADSRGGEARNGFFLVEIIIWKDISTPITLFAGTFFTRGHCRGRLSAKHLEFGL
jgi:hypothetical protein